jgi:hypothetical protein
MDIDSSHFVSVFGQFGHSSHLLGSRTAGPVPHGFDFLLFVAAEATYGPAGIGGYKILHVGLLSLFYRRSLVNHDVS